MRNEADGVEWEQNISSLEHKCKNGHTIFKGEIYYYSVDFGEHLCTFCFGELVKHDRWDEVLFNSLTKELGCGGIIEVIDGE